MTVEDIVRTLEPLGTEGYRSILRKHGIPEPLFGVKIEELKKIEKAVKKDYRLALELYETGNYDLRYLAGLIADDARMTPEDLRQWAASANCAALATSTVAWVAAGSPHGRELALEWIESPDEITACAGWSTLSSLVSITPDEKLEVAELRGLLERVADTIQEQPDRVRYSMNGFVIAVGSYVPALTEAALQAAATIGTVHVDMGDTSCKVPKAAEYIAKVQARGSLGKKRKTAKC